MTSFRTLCVAVLMGALVFGTSERASANIYASYIRVTQDISTAPFDGSFADGSGAAIRFMLNHDADSVHVVISPSGGGGAVATLVKTGLSSGDNYVNWNGAGDNGLPAATGAYSIAVTAYHSGFGTYTQTSYITSPNPFIFTRGITTVTNPALRNFGFTYAVSGGGYATGLVRHGSNGESYGSAPGVPLVPTTGQAIPGTTQRRYSPTVDADGYVYIISLTERRLYRFHTDTLDVQLFDSSAYNMAIQGLDVTGSGANKVLYVTGDTAVFRIPIGNESFNTITPEVIARAPSNKNMFFWDGKVGADGSLYISFRADSAVGPYTRARGVMKFDLTAGSLPKTIADTVWVNNFADGDPVTLALYPGATGAGSDDVLYMALDLGAPNTMLSGIYVFTNLTAAAPTRAIAWADPDNNTTSARGAVATDVVGNVMYFENSNEQVVEVAPPNAANSHTTDALDNVTVSASGVVRALVTIAEARIDEDGNRQPDRLHDTLRVIGVVHSVNLQTTNYQYLIQDDNAGIMVFRGGLVGAQTLAPGYRVMVTGYIDYFRGTTEITPVSLASDITILDTGNTVTSVPLTIGQYLADPEAYESRKITLDLVQPYNFTSAQWPTAGNSANLTVWNGVDTVIMRIDSDTEIDGSPYPTFPVTLSGGATQFTSATTTHNDGYQITPSFNADFVPVNAPPLRSFSMIAPANNEIWQIDSLASYTFRWHPAVDFNGDTLIYQFKPVAFTGSGSDNAGRDTVKTVTGATLLGYLGSSSSLAFKWTVLAKDPTHAPVPSNDTLTVILRRNAGPALGWRPQTSGVTTALYSVKAVSEDVAWAAGVGGRVLRTTDGGSTWTSVGGGAIGANDLYAIEGINATTALTTTSTATTTFLFRTTNAGASWDTVYSLTGGFLNAIHMLDANNGIAVGDPVGGTWTVLRTSNGGSSWARIATEPTQSNSEFGANNGLATVGSTHFWMPPGSNTGSIYRTTDGGATWASSTLPFSQFTAGIWFNDTQNGMAGGSGGAAALSTDGGATWTSVTLPGSGTVYGITGKGQTFYATRGNGVYKSTDLGATWTQSTTGFGAAANHISFGYLGAITYGWIVADNGAIGAYYDAPTAVGPVAGELPESFALMQNFPNPFNPTTTIRYALPKEAAVTLRVYNILGQEVATLRDEVQGAGVHDIVWRGTNDYGAAVSTGVYFYRIEARPTDGGEPFVTFKKMLMMK